MKQLDNFIQEKLKVTSNTKINDGLRDLSNVNLEYIKKEIWFNSSKEEKTLFNYIQNLYNKNTDPKQVLNDCIGKTIHYLFMVWFACATIGWVEAAKEIRKTLIKHEYADEDELDGYMLNQYNKLNGFKDSQKNISKYLNEFYVKY